jgi:DNA repair protein RadD
VSGLIHCPATFARPPVSPAIVPRRYQVEALERLAEAWITLRRRGHQSPRILLVSRTGTGKTVISGMFLERVVAKGFRAAFMVRSKVLLEQTSRHLDRIGLTDHGVIGGGSRRDRPTAPIQVCTEQALTSRGHAPPADVVVTDECEAVLCETSQAIASAYPRATFIGLTATPERSDGRPLGDFYDELVQLHASFAELVDLRALVKLRLIAPPAPSSTVFVHPIKALERHAPRLQGHKSVIFAVSVKRAHELADAAGVAGYRAAAVSGQTKTRDLQETFWRFALPERDPRALDVLTNCDLLIRGWDSPQADVGILEQGCSAWGSFIQRVGRFLRPSPETGKRGATFVDLRGSVWNCGHPCEDRIFSLAESETERNARKASMPALSSCLGCGNVYLSGPPACPSCGRVAPPQRAPRVKAAEARELGVDDVKKRKERDFGFWLKLEAEGRAKGHKPFAAFLKFKAIRGYPPPWFKHGSGAAR